MIENSIELKTKLITQYYFILCVVHVFLQRTQANRSMEKLNLAVQTIALFILFAIINIINIVNSDND